MRVLDLSSGIAGPYAAKLLGDAGADVVRPAGVGPAPLDEFLDGRKATDGAGPWDVVIADEPVDVDAAVVVMITPFGLTGPWADRPATELTMQAACGSIGHRGLPTEPPIPAGGRLGEWATGSYAGVAALAAWRLARLSGEARHVDVAMFDCMALTMATFPYLFGSFTGWPPVQGTGRSIETPSVEPVADGWVCFTTNSRQQFDDFCVLIERPEWVTDDHLASHGGRFARRDEFLAAVHAWTRGRTTDEVLELAGLLRIPTAPVLNGSTIPDFEQFAARGVLVPSASGRFLEPRVPYRITPAELATADTQIRGSAVASSGELPLSGIRVLDCTAWWAGPAASHVLALLGADVIKVESERRPDMMRYTSTKPGDPRWIEWGPVFHAVNNTKRGVTIDLTTDDGVAAFLRLVETADVIVENNTPRVFDQFGLTWDRLSSINPGLVFTRMPAFGLDGPWRDRTGFAQTMESVTGMAWRTGYADGPPVLVRGACDPIAGLHAAFATIVSLERRDQDGTGSHIESTMVEAALNASAEQVVEWTANKRLLERSAAGVHRCAGDDGWIGTEADGPFDDRTPEDAVADLQARGIPAEVVIHARDIVQNPQIQHRRLFEPVEHPVTGTHAMPGLPFRMSGVDHWVRSPAPTLGQHTDEIVATRP